MNQMIKLNLQMFARQKNAKREHYVAPFTGYDVDGEPNAPEETDYLRLAKWIPTITDSSTDTTEATGDYAGDGTPTTEVTAVAESWTFTGTYDKDNEAQALIVGKKRKIGDDRKVWHKIVMTNGDTVVGLATATDIRGGSGEATAYEEFNCILNYDGVPTVTPAIGG